MLFFGSASLSLRSQSLEDRGPWDGVEGQAVGSALVGLIGLKRLALCIERNMSNRLLFVEAKGSAPVFGSSVCLKMVRELVCQVDYLCYVCLSLAECAPVTIGRWLRDLHPRKTWTCC